MKSPIALAGWLMAAVLCLHGAWATAQTAPAASDASRLRVYLMTIGPGEAVYERFGHNQLWIHDPVAGTDIAYNYGVFDFHQENFIWRFIQGRMLYRCEPLDVRDIRAWYLRRDPGLRNLGTAQWLARDYIEANRSVWVQELNVSADQKRRLQQFLQWNAQPPNNEYRYNYYTDNCSTRLRDALDTALGGAISSQLRGVPTNTTWRWHTRRLTADHWPLYTALQAVLGPEVDRPLDQWEESFLPMKLMEHLRQVRVTNADGEQAPLVLSEWELFRSPTFVAVDEPPRAWWVWYALLGIVLGTLLAAMGRLAGRGHRIARRVMAGGIGLWSLVAGAGGAIGTWVWFTDHTAGYWNENWLQLNPLSLVLVVAGPMAALSKKGRGGKVAWGIAAVVLAMSVGGASLQVLPWFNQVNGEIICLTLPLHVGTFLAIRARMGMKEHPPASAIDA